MLIDECQGPLTIPKEGFSLSSRIAQISGVTSNAILLARLDTGTDAEIARALEFTLGALFGCRDGALDDSSRLFSCCSAG
ncbi:MAG: hypothetical protein KatS3mg059_1307 [Thermomicrobiales bacterium]|nr:MAG: hypothetical protein KatS3mg059_1307 [Thermomicrobiales bacterium]